MKICMVSRTYPPRLGGPGSMVQRLSSELVRKGFEISVVTQRISGAPRFEVDNGVAIYRELNISDKNEFTPWNLSIGIAAMTKRIIQLKQHEVFHAHDISVAGFSACLAKQIVDKPFFLKYGGDLVFEYLSLKESPSWDPREGLEGTLRYRGGFARLLHEIQRWYFKNYDLVLPDSEYGREHLTKNLNVPEEKVKVIPNVVDAEFFSPSGTKKAKAELGLNGEIVLYAGRLLEWKGLPVLIKAFRDVAAARPSANLLIGGDGPKEARLRYLIKEMGLKNKIRLLGRISRNDMPRYLNACDVFVLPSYFDTTPNALLEAMACGKPCIASDINGIREVLKDGAGLMVPVADATGLADGILHLLGDPELRRALGKKARERIEAEYSWQRLQQRFVELYEGR